MEVLSKIIDVLKIPLKVLLPAACIFSGVLSFLDDLILSKIGLLEWKQENSFIIGLVFAISAALIIVYVGLFLIKQIKRWGYELTLYPRTFKKISQMNDMEFSIIMDLYNKPGYSGTLDWGHPVVKGLLERNYIYAGNHMYVSFDVFTETWPAMFTLQPFVYRTLNHYQTKMSRKIEKISKRLQKTKSAKKQPKLQNKLNDTQQILRVFHNGS